MRAATVRTRATVDVVDAATLMPRHGSLQANVLVEVVRHLPLAEV